jgi:hypothetical protein
MYRVNCSSCWYHNNYVHFNNHTIVRFQVSIFPISGARRTYIGTRTTGIVATKLSRLGNNTTTTNEIKKIGVLFLGIRRRYNNFAHDATTVHHWNPNIVIGRNTPIFSVRSTTVHNMSTTTTTTTPEKMTVRNKHTNSIPTDADPVTTSSNPVNTLEKIDTDPSNTADSDEVRKRKLYIICFGVSTIWNVCVSKANSLISFSSFFLFFLFD